jgi:hypothetical protein
MLILRHTRHVSNTKLNASILLYSVPILNVRIQSSKLNFYSWLNPIQRPGTLGFAATVPTRKFEISLETSTGIVPSWQAAQSACDIPKPCAKLMDHVTRLDGLCFVSINELGQPWLCSASRWHWVHEQDIECGYLLLSLIQAVYPSAHTVDTNQFNFCIHVSLLTWTSYSLRYPYNFILSEISGVKYLW